MIFDILGSMETFNPFKKGAWYIKETPERYRRAIRRRCEVLGIPIKEYLLNYKIYKSKALRYSIYTQKDFLRFMNEK